MDFLGLSSFNLSSGWWLLSRKLLRSIFAYFSSTNHLNASSKLRRGRSHLESNLLPKNLHQLGLPSANQSTRQLSEPLRGLHWTFEVFSPAATPGFLLLPVLIFLAELTYSTTAMSIPGIPFALTLRCPFFLAPHNLFLVSATSPGFHLTSASLFPFSS